MVKTPIAESIAVAQTIRLLPKVFSLQVQPWKSSRWMENIQGRLCLRFFDAGLSAIFQLGATLARVGKHD
jgi:hypothetical protein